MKKILFLLVISAFSFTSCKNKGEAKANSIIGKWKPVEMNIEMNEQDKKDMMASTVLEFTTDNKFIVHRKDSKRDGTYKMEGAELTTVTEGGNEEKFTVSWDSDKLVMTNKEGVVKLKKD